MGETHFEVFLGIELHLFRDWNLIGIPFNPPNPSIEGIFGDNIKKIRYIYGFNNEEKGYRYWVKGLCRRAFKP